MLTHAAVINKADNTLKTVPSFKRVRQMFQKVAFLGIYLFSIQGVCADSCAYRYVYMHECTYRSQRTTLGLCSCLLPCRFPLCVPGCLAQGLLCILMSLLPSRCKEHWVTDGCYCVQLVCILGIPARVLRHAQQALYPPSHPPSLLLGIFFLFSNHSTSLYQQITWHQLKNLEQGTGGLLRSLVPL